MVSSYFFFFFPTQNDMRKNTSWWNQLCWAALAVLLIGWHLCLCIIGSWWQSLCPARRPYQVHLSTQFTATQKCILIPDIACMLYDRTGNLWCHLYSSFALDPIVIMSDNGTQICPKLTSESLWAQSQWSVKNCSSSSSSLLCLFFIFFF